MIFPEIKILEEVAGDKYYNRLLRCHLDWSEVDTHKKKSRIDWCNKFLTESLSDNESVFLNEMLNEGDWDEFNYPKKFKHLYESCEYINIPVTYYEELKHLKELALSEWNRSRPFDTSVREHLLSTSIKSIELFFYLLSDSLLYNNLEYNTQGIFLKDRCRSETAMNILWLFRFWKHQTGDGLVLIRSLSPFTKGIFTDEFISTLKENMEFKIIDGLTIQSLSRNKELKNIIKQKMRDKRLNSILPS
jgi:hypothetical protein